MTDDEFKNLSNELVLGEPGTPDLIAETHRNLGFELPNDYVDFIKRANGADGPFGKDGYLNLWPVHDLRAKNKGYQVDDFAPGLLLFGSDGGGEAFAFDTRDPTLPVVGVPFVGLSLKEIQPLAESFLEFLKNGGSPS
jgi:hypothetical protein